MSGESRQDTWFVSVTYRSAEGRELFGRKGVLELPRPMTSSDAADYAVRVEVRDIVRMIGTPNIPRQIHAMIWQKGANPGEGHRRVYGAFAEYDPNLDAFMLFMPNPNNAPREPRKEVGATEGAKFRPFDW